MSPKTSPGRFLPLCLLSASASLFAAFDALADGAGHETGAALYAEHCIDCHLETGEGEDPAPDIRSTSDVSLKKALAGLDSMPEFEFTAAEREALRLYLRSLHPDVAAGATGQ